MQLELTMFCEMLATSNNKIFFCAKLDGGALEHGISTQAKMFFLRCFEFIIKSCE